MASVEEWAEFAPESFPVRFRYPQSVEGVRVTVREDQQEGNARIHLSAEGKLYFELLCLRNLTPQLEYERHRAYLEDRFGPGSVSDIEPTAIGSFAVATYSFAWPQHCRTVVSVAHGADTFRVIYDPEIPLNLELLGTLRFEGDA